MRRLLVAAVLTLAACGGSSPDESDGIELIEVYIGWIDLDQSDRDSMCAAWDSLTTAEVYERLDSAGVVNVGEWVYLLAVEC